MLFVLLEHLFITRLNVYNGLTVEPIYILF